nr:immunoglobulin light chain junction region [Macaca mulatta]MOV61613.1 immunoglobulin light chain junction region [Macaca mulatta]MOV63664.1 immunoglobulin light chain junction region [Macaca mulatta]
CQHHNSYPFTF